MTTPQPPAIDWSEVITDRPPPVRPSPSRRRRRVQADDEPAPIEVFDLLGAPDLSPEPPR